MKPWLDTALVYLAMAQVAGAETEPSIALSLLHFPELLFSKLSDVVCGHALLVLGYLFL